MMGWIKSLPRLLKKVISSLIDQAFLLFAVGVASWQLSTPLSSLWSDNTLAMLLWFCGSYIGFVCFGIYRIVLRYISPRAFVSMFSGIALSALLLFSTVNLAAEPAFKFVLVFSLIALVCVTGSRFVFSWLLGWAAQKPKKRVIVYGAGYSGRMLVQALQNDESTQAIAFVDDSIALQKTMIGSLPVYSPKLLAKIIERRKIDSILLAIPSLDSERRRALLATLSFLKIPVQTIPDMPELLSGRMKIDDIQDIRIEDLLGREIVEPNHELLCTNITNKVVMVTGAGGSIGSELCRQIFKVNPRVLVLFDISEFALYQIERELSSLGASIPIKAVLGSVQHRKLLERVMQRFSVQTVYHAAAYKHVPLVEFNMVEGVRNNVFGTLSCAEAAISSNVETFVLISTDKAVRPTNVMGASKRMAELVIQGLSTRPHQTKMSMVRFGNVLGSSGSVVPLFSQQIRTGGPVTLTHQDITRFFMTIPEASQLVIQAGGMAKGGEVFVLDMGEPVRIYDLARRMIDLAGLSVKDDENPTGDIEIKITGLRPGEKLFEELLIGSEDIPTKHQRIRAANEHHLSWPATHVLINSLEVACQSSDQEMLRQILLDAPTGFAPTTEINDLLFVPTSKEQILVKEFVH